MIQNKNKGFQNWWRKLKIIFLVLLLSGCSYLENSQPQLNGPEQLKGEILFWLQNPIGLKESETKKYQKLFQQLVAEFNELYPNIEVLVQFFPSREIFDAFELQVQRGAGPDLILFQSNSKIAPLIEAGILRSLIDLDESNLYPEALQQIRYQDKFYGLPIYLSTQVLCYNKHKVKDQKLPLTLSDLIEQTRQGYSVGIHSGFWETLWGTGIVGGIFQGQVTLAQEEGWSKWIQWMEWLKNAENEPNFILSNDVEALKKAFVTDRLAYVTCSSAWISYFRETLEPNKLGVTLLPAIKNQPGTPLIWASSLFFSKASSPHQNKLAIKLAQFLRNVEQQKQIAAEIPYIPSNNKIEIHSDLYPIKAVLLAQAKNAVGASLDDYAKVRIITDQGNLFYQKVLSGEISPEEAAVEIREMVNRKVPTQP
jgi:ABC-type glycerol-3-phosphate transport system substrate-binding protein